LRADVPIAFCLSGGLDSSAIVATAAKELGATVHAFSIIDSDPRYDERSNINAITRHLDIPHTSIELGTDRFLPRLAKLIEYHQKPIATISYYAHSLLAEAIHGAGFKVAVSGTGADELLGGYYEHFLLHLRSVRAEGQRAYDDALGAWRAHVLPFVRNPFLRDPVAFDAGESEFSHLLVGVASFMDSLRDPLPVAFHEANYSDDPFSNRLLNELFHEIVPVILEEDDRNSMCYSVENRSPFLDSSLFEFCFSVPRSELISSGYSKSLLRDALVGVIPDQVRLDREKKGFNASLNTLIRFSDPETLAYLLADGPIFDIVDRERIRHYFVDTALANSVSKFLFGFIGMKLFLDGRAGLLPERFGEG
jgi:asparagine synthase (glutamine-hydrolysing)